MSDFTVLQGIEHLKEIDTCIELAFDCETTGLKPTRGGLRLLQLGCNARKKIVLIDCFDLDDNGWGAIQRLANNGDRFWLAHNSVFDLGWLAEHDIHLRGKVGDTMLASKLLNNGLPVRHSLADVCRRYLKRELDKEQQRSDWSGDLTPEQLAYAAKDVEVLLELSTPLEKRLRLAGLMDAYALECQALPALAEMWRCGLPWDREALQATKTDYEFDIDTIGKEFIEQLDAALPEEHKLPRHEDGTFNLNPRTSGSVRLGTKVYAGFNLNSPKQLIERFSQVLGTTPVDANGKPSASRQALRSYAADHEVIQIYLAWKKAEKRRQMCESLLEHMGSDGFVRASYMQLGADTGRMSCREPNLQQVPRDESFRKCVTAPEGWSLVDADFSGMELRLAAAVTGDEAMTEAFQAGEDLHTVTAEAIGCDRQVAKSANFGLLYGSGATGLRNYAGAMGITMSQEEAASIRNAWLNQFAGVNAWQRANAADADALVPGGQNPSIRVPGSGLRRFLPGDLNRLTVRCNTPIQGAGAAILKVALGNLWPLVKQAGPDKVRIAAAVHDEVILLVRDEYAKEWAETLQQVMEKAESLWLGYIPAVAEAKIAKNWADAH